ncbi:MAG: EscU/YscU/HrcU family type III secretion system export apparatus switch protein [Candidatus Sericytochromatia bacterium]|uniref:EscU/YscU/HrcU family type III secretion system export apparatus switch protein n=1 Tax=Candidatus Tanganyikabacteria bacterium TaxID=2961651 RepID=A0A937X374_9BACT|nr:EscU/YscU/HrcU family type III secretion system export apparatus switch protein [Candidatus Tanganyikabacteria bacterium]
MVAEEDLDPQSSQKRAVALRYDEGKNAAPVVVATGRGRMAEAIIAAAREHGIPIQEDAQLVEALAKLDLGETIPAELYPVVAEVLVFVARANRDRAKAKRRSAGP